MSNLSGSSMLEIAALTVTIPVSIHYPQIAHHLFVSTHQLKCDVIDNSCLFSVFPLYRFWSLFVTPSLPFPWLVSPLQHFSFAHSNLLTVSFLFSLFTTKIISQHFSHAQLQCFILILRGDFFQWSLWFMVWLLLVLLQC